MPPKKTNKITMSSTNKIIEGDGLPNLPAKVQSLYKKVKDDKIKKMEIFRRPVGKAIEKALDAFSGNAVEEFFKKTEYDKLFHLGIIINDKFLFHKQENFTLERIPGGYKKFLKSKDLELSPVSNYGDITIKDLFRRTRDKMGDKKFYGYDAFKNNCQDFVVKALESVNAKFDKDFVKQNLKKLSKKVPTFTKSLTNFFTDFARTARRLVGLGAGSSKKKNSSLHHHYEPEQMNPNPMNKPKKSRKPRRDDVAPAPPPPPPPPPPLEEKT